MIAAVFLAAPAGADTIRAGVLRVDDAGLPPVSRLDLPPADMGFAGARLATEDNAPTGRFMGHTFETVEITGTPGNRTGRGRGDDRRWPAFHRHPGR